MSEELPGGYVAARDGLAVFDRSGRTRLVVKGPAPAQMLNGILTGTLPSEPGAAAEGVLGGTATYHAVLTPKGKMVTDLWALRLGDEDVAGFLLDVPEAGSAPLLTHLGKYLPPRFARLDDVSGSTGALAVVGPLAAEALSRLALGFRVDPPELASLPEGAWRAAGSTAADAVLVMRTGDVWPEAFLVLGPGGAVDSLRSGLAEAGAVAGERQAWTTLRVEAGRPAFGVDMDNGTIPVEAGIHERAIDYGKGCYTGQEVIVRIRDRGHVNRSLRQLHLGDAPVPEAGTELFAEGSEKPVGRVTSAVRSPRFGETVALGYVRREVEGDVRLGPR